MGRMLAGVGLAYFAYSFIQIVSKWQYRTTTEKVIWFIVIAVGGGLCLSILVR